MKRSRVLVVDDSATIRRLVADAVVASADLELAATAQNGQAALDRLEAAAPDVVLLDVDMPVLDGITALRAIKASRPRLPVLMFSSQTEHGALATLDALAAGASDFVAKPTVSGPDEARSFVDREVLPRLRALAGRPARGPMPGVVATAVASAPGAPPGAARAGGVAVSSAAQGAVPYAPPAPSRVAPTARPGPRVEAVVLAISTGGPQALAALVPAFPRGFPVPVLVVQHMPAFFTRVLADRLSTLGPLPVAEAVDGAPATPGRIHLAPGGHHLVIERRAAGPVLRIDDGPPENSCRPAADPLFRSAAQVWGDGVLAVVMTGMGRDGCAGAEKVRERGGTVLAQDEETSVVWGMPRAVAEAGLAAAVLPLDELGREIVARVVRGRAAVGRAG